MTNTVKRPEQTLYFSRGAAFVQPFRARTDSETGPRVVFDSTVKARIVWKGESLDLTVGSGITLQAVDLANEQFTMTLTEAQTRSMPAGNFSSYEIQTGAPGAETIFLAGRMIGQGGDNPDG